jgi:uncharacterized lipoprotein YmbA
MKSPALVCCMGLLAACAANHPDHFYILSALPPGASEARTAPATQAALKVTLPSLVDRAEIVLNTSADGVVVLEHQRWAAPLTDLVTQTLARDIERRRSDLLVAVPSAGHSGTAAIKLAIDIVQVTIHKGARASIETHWRILDGRTGKETIGGDVFGASMGQDDYAGVVQAISECLGLLADRLVGQLPAPE